MPKFLNLIQYVDDGTKWTKSTNPNNNESGLRIIKLSQFNEPGTTIMRGPDGRAQIFDPNSDLDIANKKYVDDQNANDVHLTGDQTISGAKTFNGKTVLSGGATVPSDEIKNDDSVVNKKYMLSEISAAVSTGQDNFPLTIGDGEYSVVQKRIKSDGSTVTTRAYQRGSAAFGGGTVAGDSSGAVTAYSFAFAANENNEAIARSSAAFGRYNKTYNPGEFVCGNYAEGEEIDKETGKTIITRNAATVFLVGGGTTSTKRHNAFEVRTDHSNGVDISTAYIGGRMVATQDYVNNTSVHKEGVPWVVYATGKDEKGNVTDEVIPYRFKLESIKEAEFHLMFQPMTDGRIYTRYPTDEYHAANKGYVDNTWNNFNLENGTGIGSLIQKTHKAANKNPQATGLGAIAFGGFRGDKPNNQPDAEDRISIAAGIQSATFGAGTQAHGNWDICAGKDSDTYQKTSFTFGGKCQAGDESGDVNAYSFAFAANENSQAKARSSAVFGRYNTSYNPGEFVCGNYADENRDAGALFIVGGGTAQSDGTVLRHNAFEVRTNYKTVGTKLTINSSAFIGGEMVATQEYVGNNAVKKMGNSYVLYGNESGGKSSVIPYRFNKQSIIDAEYQLMFQPMTDGRLYTRYPTDEYHTANKGYVDNIMSETRMIPEGKKVTISNIGTIPYVRLDLTGGPLRMRVSGTGGALLPVVISYFSASSFTIKINNSDYSDNFAVTKGELSKKAAYQLNGLQFIRKKHTSGKNYSIYTERDDLIISLPHKVIQESTEMSYASEGNTGGYNLSISELSIIIAGDSHYYGNFTLSINPSSSTSTHNSSDTVDINGVKQTLESGQILIEGEISNDESIKVFLTAE